MNNLKIVNLYIYPIKSCQGIEVKSAQVTAKGLCLINNSCNCTVGDRTFMLVNEQGKFLTQREYPQLATIKVDISDNNLILSSENNDISPFELTILEENISRKVTVWRDETIGIDQGEEVAKWFKNALKLNTNCYLVKQSPQYIRPINSKYSLKENQPVSFADGFPFLLTNTASLAELNHQLKVKYPQDNLQIPMKNFRPNIVIDTDTPFIEDTWEEIEINLIKFKLVKPCSRCIIITTHQKTGARNPYKEPLLTLGNFRKTQDGIMFGQNMIALSEGVIHVSSHQTIKHEK
ncbi:MOSC domain-containing protein [Cyanobacterium aponinum]|uniref:MOSC domain protein beta barrel domain protein n=1 Tax=Cyanobacterium aponinum (strain PCC 10605) TaxID=755178 RepID=K9Z4M1_CYAAP|nr:MOSC N-terminal beta barrel domain-containing protein [Cyanobacterium aponinum]AFZ53343.1 MOSC domain protein beta barrel domain protein [Cyanobacterium aponinum PCC 10605]